MQCCGGPAGGAVLPLTSDLSVKQRSIEFYFPLNITNTPMALLVLAEIVLIGPVIMVVAVVVVVPFVVAVSVLVVLVVIIVLEWWQE